MKVIISLSAIAVTVTPGKETVAWYGLMALMTKFVENIDTIVLILLFLGA